MPRKITPLKEITPQSPSNWCARVRVVEKHSVRGHADSPKRHQKNIFAGAEGLELKGTRVQVTVWSDCISLLGRRLRVFGTYYISKAFVKICYPEYQIVPNNFEWTIHGKTLIEECTDNEFREIDLVFRFAPFSVFSQYVRSPVELDVLGVVLAMQLPRYIRMDLDENIIQEAVILNRELQPVLLTFWDHIVNQECVHLYADNLVIAAFQIKELGTMVPSK